MQLPEVHLEIKQGEGSRSAHHLLETSLTAEGTRAYKIDGRIKAATQVKVGANCLLWFSSLLQVHYFSAARVVTLSLRHG